MLKKHAEEPEAHVAESVRESEKAAGPVTLDRATFDELCAITTKRQISVTDHAEAVEKTAAIRARVS